MRSRLTQASIDADLGLLYDYESDRSITQADLAEREGQCRQRISQRLARARRWRAEIARAQEQDRQVRTPEGESLPFVALTSDPENERGDWYDLRTDAMTVEDRPVRIGSHNGGHLLLMRPWQGAIDATAKGPTSHKPDPKGLKGGIG